jgi:hypothetical protein
MKTILVSKKFSWIESHLKNKETHNILLLFVSIAAEPHGTHPANYRRECIVKPKN